MTRITDYSGQPGEILALAVAGEKLDKDSLRSSIARRTGLSRAGLPKETRFTGGLVDMLLDGVSNYIRFVTIHPIEDGNGKIARPLTDKALDDSEMRIGKSRFPDRFYMILFDYDLNSRQKRLPRNFWKPNRMTIKAA